MVRKGAELMKDLEQEIGTAAGKIWEALRAKGELPKSKIAQATGLSAGLANQGIGWLAREGKITSEKTKKSELIKLKE